MKCCFFLVAIFFIKLQNNSRQNVRQNHRVWVPVEGTFEIILGLTWKEAVSIKFRVPSTNFKFHPQNEVTIQSVQGISRTELQTMFFLLNPWLEWFFVLYPSSTFNLGSMPWGYYPLCLFHSDGLGAIVFIYSLTKYPSSWVDARIACNLGTLRYFTDLK